MWMASATYHDPTRRAGYLPAYRWNAARLAAGERQLARVLEGVGDPAHERLCVNVVALIWSRRLTDAEIDAANLRGVCARDPAGTPWRIVWERGESFAPSTQPCANAGVWVPPGLGIPQVQECGRCTSCLARARL